MRNCLDVMLMLNKKIVFIGAGNMAYACVKGFIDIKSTLPSNIGIYDIDKSKYKNFNALDIVVFSNLEEAISFGDFIVLAVKPQVIERCLSDISLILKSENKTFIS